MSEKKKPEYQLWFHKFLIFFALWACAVLAVLTGIQGIASTIENGMSNKVLFMADGSVVESGPSKAFFEHPQQARSRDFIKSILDARQ